MIQRAFADELSDASRTGAMALCLTIQSRHRTQLHHAKRIGEL